MSAPDSVFNPHALTGPPPEADSPQAIGASGAGASGAGASGPGPSERDLERALRPASFEEFVGQARTIGNLEVAIQAAAGRGEPLDHVLLSGPPGLGKTSLARILARELGGGMHTTTGPALERPRDLVGVLTQLKRGDVLFIDEIHRVPATVEEYLYAAMEDFAIDITIDQGPHARVLSLTIEPFCLVGATTREGLLSSPFRGRFGIFERLVPYPVEDLVEVLCRSARILGLDLAPEAARLLASRSRGTPRIANRFLRRVRDLAQVAGKATIDEELAEEAMRRIGVDTNGLEDMDRRILRCIAQQGGQPVGIKTIAAAVGEAEDTIEDAFEPHLLRKGLLQRTPRGRQLTPQGLTAIGLEADQDQQGDLFS